MCMYRHSPDNVLWTPCLWMNGRDKLWAQIISLNPVFFWLYQSGTLKISEIIMVFLGNSIWLKHLSFGHLLFNRQWLLTLGNAVFEYPDWKLFSRSYLMKNFMQNEFTFLLLICDTLYREILSKYIK